MPSQDSSDLAAVADLVDRSLDPATLPTFERRVADQADRLREAVPTEAFDNEVFTVGLELEGYAVDGEGRLARIPDAVFETAPCAKELGLHNVECNTAPDAFDEAGLSSQRRQLAADVEATRAALADHDLELVLDAMWTIPPVEGSLAYLTETRGEATAGAGSETDRDRVTVAANMRPAPRYVAIDNDVVERAGGAVELRLPGVRLSLPTILVESLTASIQPHLQVPDREAFPTYYRTGIRTLGPVLALTTNSPFLPADLYGAGESANGDHTDESPGDAAGYGGRTPDWTIDADADPYAVVDRTFHELRIPVFEQSINTGPDDRKVRFPADLERATDVVDYLLADRTCAPFLKEWVKEADAVDGYADRIWELDHKRGTYWRWLRAVPGGEPLDGVTERSLRIEYRPLPTQPTVAETVACQAFVAGLLRGLVAADHPVADQSWAAARENFYRAVEDGLDAELTWIDASGERVSAPDAIFAECLEYARRGLAEQGLSTGAIDEFLGPIEARIEARITPSRWKKRAVRERLDGGGDLRSAIEGMQREYVRRSAADEPVTEW